MEAKGVYPDGRDTTAAVRRPDATSGIRADRWETTLAKITERRHRIGVLVILAPVLSAAGCAGSRVGSQGATTHPAPPAEVSLPGIVIVPATGEVRIGGRTCIDSGIVEYVAVGTHGKAYESLFVLDCRPSHLQMAMFLARYQEGELPPEVRGDFSAVGGSAADLNGPAATRPAASSGSDATTAAAGARPADAPPVTSPPREYWHRPAQTPTCVTIDVDVQQADGSWQRRRIESFLADRRTGQAPARLAWAFTGSFFLRESQSEQEVFAADLEESLIALWYDPTALLNLTQDVGNPYRGDASGLAVNPAMSVKRGTPVRLVLRPIRGK